MRFSGFATLALAAFALLETAVARPRNIPAIRPLPRPGIVYSPFGAHPGTCKSTDQIQRELLSLQGEYGLIRLYGLECEQVKEGLEFVQKTRDVKLMLGIFDLHKLEEEVQRIWADVRQYAGGDWSRIHTISVGNEFILAGKYSAGQLVDMTNRARQLLRPLGYGGPVVTVNVFYEVLQNPGQLCKDQDYIAVNAHAFFDGKLTARDAGAFVENMRRQVQAACQAATGKNMDVYITETGWPTQGESNGACVPGVQQQREAMAGIRQHCGNHCIHFTAFDETWKEDSPATLRTEKHWGIHSPP